MHGAVVSALAHADAIDEAYGGAGVPVDWGAVSREFLTSHIKGLRAAISIDFQSQGQRPAPRKAIGSKPASCSSWLRVRRLQNLM